MSLQLDVTSYRPPGPIGNAFLKSRGPIDAIMGPGGSGKTVVSVIKGPRHAAEYMPVCRDGWVRVKTLCVRDTYRSFARTALASWYNTFPEKHPWTVSHEGGIDRPVVHTLQWEAWRGPDKVKVEYTMETGAIGDNDLEAFAKGYAQFSGELPAEIKPHVDTLAGDPLFSRVSEKALALKVPVPVYQALVQEFVSVSHEMGMMEPIIDEAAERAALLPETAKHLPETEQKAAVEKRMNDNFAFMDALATRGVDNGGLAKDDVDFAKAMLGDSAKGHRVLEFLRAAAGGGEGGGPAMLAGTTASQDPRKELKLRAALPQNTFGHKDFDRASYDALQADYKRQIGA